MKLFIGLVLAATAAASLHAQVATFKGGVDLVSFSVTAVDRKGKLITDLREPEFEVYEDGKRQKLTYFTAGTGRADDSAAAALHLGVVFDISGSMEGDLRLSRSAAIKFLRTLDDAEDMTLVDFDTEVRVARFSRDEFPRLVERIRSRKAEGYTALFDAMGVYLHGASFQDGRKILVLYTDGADNDSQINFGDTMDLLKASDVSVYAIGFMQHVGSAAMELRSRLKQIAETTGGESYFPTSLKDLDGVYERIRDEIRAQYVVGWVSSNPRTDGTWRKVEIKVRRPGLSGVKVRTRKGYFAPVR